MRGTRFYTLCALVLGGWLAATAGATTFVVMDEATLLRTSDAVITGTVTAIESAAADPDGRIYTYVHVEPDRIIKGSLDNRPLVLREPGGTVGDQREWIFGAPEFWVGERSLLFLTRNPDGTLQTHSLAMGKFTLSVDLAGHATAVRDLGHGASVLVPETGQIVDAQPERHRFLSLLRRLRHQARADRTTTAPRPLVLTSPDLTSTYTEVQDAYTFLSSPPARWFEPDSGQTVSYLIDENGDSTLGFATSRAAVDAAFAVWTNVPTSNLILADGGTTPPGAFSGCTFNRILFNDPSGEIADPSGCGGILAIGGYCSSGATTVVNGTTFNRIVVGKVMFNNGWGGCSAWNLCNVAEVATHEIGHTIGFGHSADGAATMYASAHFDGRCAGLGVDDVAGLNFMYPQPGAATGTPTRSPTRTPTRTPTATLTRTPTRTPTKTAAPTLTPTRSPTRTATAPPSATATASATRTATASASATATRTPTPTFTLTRTSTAPATATSTATWTPTWTLTATPSVTLTATPTATQTWTPTATPTRYTMRGKTRYYSSDVAVGGATVEMQPDAVATQTDASGAFEFIDVPNEPLEVMPRKLGDAGSAVSALDAVYVLQALSGTRTLTAEQALAADVSGDGTLSAMDAALILQFRVGLIPRFPVAETCGSDWMFVPVPAAAPNQELIQPQATVGVCQPGAIAFDPLSDSVGGQDFHAILFGDCTGNWQGGGGSPLVAPLRVPATVRVGRFDRRRNRMRLPIHVRATQPFEALDLDVRYAPADLRVVGVRRLGMARGAVVAFDNRQPGLVRIALASAMPVQTDARALLVLQFADGSKPVNSARAVRMTVDDHPALTRP
jgi:hypothetical protein